MKPSRDLFTGARVLRAALAVAVFGLPLAAQAATASYTITSANLVNMPNNCGAGSMYSNCSTSPFPGYTWSDTIPAGSTITAVNIRFNVGVDCHGTGTALTTTLNGTASGSFSAVSWCSCALREQNYTMSLPAGAYIRGAANSFLWTNPGTCLGSCPSAAFGGQYAIVDVTYTAGGGGGTGGTCDLTPIEAKLDNGTRWVNDAELAAAVTNINNNNNTQHLTTRTTIINALNPGITRLESKLDDGTRFTSDTERTTQTNTIVTEINANETKIDRLESKLDDETRFTSDAELAAAQQSIEAGVAALEAKADGQGNQLTSLEQANLEHALGEDNNVNKPMAHYMIPQAYGGHLEDVRDLVQQRINEVIAAGCNTGSAQSQHATGVAEMALGHWDTAYGAFAGAYRTLTMGPCN